MCMEVVQWNNSLLMRVNILEGKKDVTRENEREGERDREKVLVLMSKKKVKENNKFLNK